MKKLLVHCSYDDDIGYLCRRSGRNDIDTDVLELREFSASSKIGCKINSLKNKRAKLGLRNISLDEYDMVIFACEEWMGVAPPVLNSFIENSDLRFKNVVCIVFGNGSFAKKAADGLRVKVALSGGTVKNAITVSAKALKTCDEDVLFYVRHKLAV